MNAHNQYIFIMRTVEESDGSPRGNGAVDTPEKIMIQFLGGRGFERLNPAALRVHAGHDMANRSIFSRRVHALEHDQEGTFVLRVQL